jgi:hypothetical protein
MRICVIVETHELASEVLIPPCFALLHCGDWSIFGRSVKALDALYKWLGEPPAEFKLITCGNDEYPVAMTKHKTPASH